MEIVIDIDPAVPKFAVFWLGLEVGQIVAQIRRAARAGVVKAYRLLEGEGVVRVDVLGRTVVC